MYETDFDLVAGFTNRVEGKILIVSWWFTYFL